MDMSDGYAVNLSNDSHSFQEGDTPYSTETQIQAYCGKKLVPAVVNLSEVEKPSGVTVTKDTDTTAPTLTITVTSVASGTVKIPVKITSGKDTITITKYFSFSFSPIGPKGDSLTITTKTITYQVGDSGTEIPTGTWESTVQEAPAGKYLWTKTYLKYSDNTETESYTVAYKAKDGEDANPLTVTIKEITYQASSSGTTVPDGTWEDTVQEAGAVQGQFLWTKTYMKYSDNTETVAYSVAYQAIDGTDGYTPVKGTDYFDGEDGISPIDIKVITSDGTVLKNNEGSTTCTAYVFQDHALLSDAQVAELGTLKWYKTDDDENFVSAGTGKSITVPASDIDGTAVYTVQLESDE